MDLIRENSYKYNKSSLVQKVTLSAGSDMVRFDTTVDWHEELKMLRADFVPTVFADNVKCNIQFGNFDRTTLEDDKDEDYNPKWAQFEVCAHKFVNIDGEDYGFALLNNGKYGHRAKTVSFPLLCSARLYSPTRLAIAEITVSVMQSIRIKKNSKTPTLWRKDIALTIQ